MKESFYIYGNLLYTCRNIFNTYRNILYTYRNLLYTYRDLLYMYIYKNLFYFYRSILGWDQGIFMVLFLCRRTVTNTPLVPWSPLQIFSFNWKCMTQDLCCLLLLLLLLLLYRSNKARPCCLNTIE